MLLTIFTLFLLGACNQEEIMTTEIPGEICEYKTAITSPDGYYINSVSEIDFNGSVQSFQFVNEAVGYAILGNNVGGHVEIFKTENGGETWSDLKIGLDKLPRSMIFKNENTGIITVHDITGCPPPNCQNRCVILKTIDGGITWEEKEITNLKGILYHPKFDEAGNLYATLSLNNEYTLVKSSDDGETWEIFFDAPEVGFSLVTFSFEIFENELYISGQDGRILVVDLNGDLLNILDVGVSPIWDLEIIDRQQLIVVGSTSVVKTTNRGMTWQIIYPESARMIGFTTPEKGLMVLNKSFCPTDVYQANDLIGSTVDGGLSWQEAEETTSNLRINFQNSQKLNDNIWYLMFGNELFLMHQN